MLSKWIVLRAPKCLDRILYALELDRRIEAQFGISSVHGWKIF
jgi:hypothetical protein